MKLELDQIEQYEGGHQLISQILRLLAQFYLDQHNKQFETQVRMGPRQVGPIDPKQMEDVVHKYVDKMQKWPPDPLELHG